MSLTSVRTELAASPTDRPSKWRRRWLPFAAVLIVLMGTAGVAAWRLRHEPALRWLLHRSAAAAYWVYDPARDVVVPTTGPYSARANDRADLVAGLARVGLADWVIETENELEGDPAQFFFQHEPHDSPPVRAFREASQPLWEGAKDPFEMCNRFRALTTHRAVSESTGEDDPLAFLRLAQQRVGLTCRYFAMTFVSLCAVQGYTGRVLGLSRDADHWDHALTEIYLPRFGKWVLIDPDFNVAFRLRGKWLSAAEIRAEWLKVKSQLGGDGKDTRAFCDRIARDKARTRRLTEIELVPLGSAGEDLRQSNLYPGATGLNLELFEFVIYGCRDDYLTNHYPTGHPRAATQYLLRQRPNDRPPTLLCPEAYVVDDPGMLYFPIGRCRFHVEEIKKEGPSGNVVVSLSLSTYTPNFLGFEVRDGGGPWRTISGTGLAWGLKIGQNTLEARAMNAAKLPGEPARLRVAPRPAPQ